MNTREGIRDETITAAFQRRADRGEPGDLHVAILTSTAATAQQRPWRTYLSFSATRPVVRVAWLAVLLAATLLILGMLLVAGGRTLTARPPAEYVWSAVGTGNGMYFATGTGGAIEVDPVGHIWVADTGYDRFAIFDPAGRFLEYWGTAGSDDGRFRMRLPNGAGVGAVAFAPDGTFYVLDAGNHRIQEFDRDRRLVRTWSVFRTGGTSFQQPTGIAAGADGTVYVLRDGGDVVERFDREGTSLGSFTLHLPEVNSTTGLAVDSAGNVYVGICCRVADEIRKYDPTGAQVATFGHHDGITAEQWVAIRVAPDGRLFATRGPFTTHDRLYVFDPTGVALTSFGQSGSGDGQFAWGYPGGLALSGDSVYLTDVGAERLEKFRLLPAHPAEGQ